MAATLCPHCQTELPEGTNPCPHCGAVLPSAQPVSFAPAFAGIALFVVVLLVCEWLQILWPVAVAGVAFLVFLVVKYGKLAYVPPTPRVAKMEAEVPVAQLLEKVEVPEPEVEKAEEPVSEPEPVKTEVPEAGPICPSCGEPRNGAPRFCGNCGKPFKD